MNERDSGRGEVRAISSLTNPVIKDIRALAMKKERERTGLFTAEGLKLVTDAIDSGWDIRQLVHSVKVRDQTMVRRTIAAAQARGALVLEVTDAVLEKIARRDNPQMVIGVFAQRWLRLADLDPARQTLVIALEGVKDPGNLGTVVRTADAVGASAVVLIGETTDPFGTEAVRASMGSIFARPLVRAGIDEFFDWAGAHRLPVVGTHLKGAVDYRAVEWREPGILLMGNEQSGLPQPIAERCDALVKIPMAGTADSLNLAIATAVVAFEARRGRLAL
ncbi:MAG: RNA methyltransferase [Hyphomicrobiaceae bacterium]|nr:RNA methyltransferase [Hyphomicrobiaceae bacterium]